MLQAESSRPVWWHTLVLVVPAALTVTDTVMVWLTDGNNSPTFQPDLTDYNMLGTPLLLLT